MKEHDIDKFLKEFNENTRNKEDVSQKTSKWERFKLYLYNNFPRTLDFIQYITYGFAIVFIIPLIILFWLLPKWIYYTYYDFILIGKYRCQFSLNDTFSRDIYLMFHPCLQYILKHYGIYHKDKPELIDDILIDTYIDYIENEDGINEGCYNGEDAESLYNKIIEWKLKCKSVDSSSVYEKDIRLCTKLEKEKREIVNKIFKIHTKLWT